MFEFFKVWILDDFFKLLFVREFLRVLYLSDIIKEVRFFLMGVVFYKCFREKSNRLGIVYVYDVNVKYIYNEVYIIE